VVNWRTGIVLIAILAAVGVYAYVSRPQPQQVAQSAPFLPCPTQKTVYVHIEGGGRVMEMQRATPTDEWRLTQPFQAATDSNSASNLTSSIDSIKVLDTIASPGQPSQYGLDAPHETLTCRVITGSSYTLSIGNQSFDGSGRYASKGGDRRIFVISSVEVDEFDRVLAKPPVTPSPSPTS
jgi:hypothetical protein